MTSQKQIESNRRNAQLSTGPRTEGGKANSRGNAMTHGLTAQKLLLPGEDPEEFAALRDAVFEETQPATVYEKRLVNRLVGLMWRLGRVEAYEAAIFSWVGHRQEEIHDSDHSANANPAKGIMRFGQHKGLRRSDTQLDPEERERLELGRMLQAALERDLTSKLDRHEAHLIRQLDQTSYELNNCLARREIELMAEPA